MICPYCLIGMNHNECIRPHSQDDERPIILLPADTLRLVIAARKFWDERNDDTPESRNLDKALEAFASRVPYADDPEALAARGQS